MRVADATSLARGEQGRPRARQLRIEPYDAEADRQALVQLAQRCERFSPAVGVEEGESPDSLLLDITGLMHLFGSEQYLTGQVTRCFREWGYVVRIAVADTLGAAWAMAHFAEVSAEAAESQPRIVPTGGAACVDSLPIEALRLPQSLLDVLQELGILRIAQLRPLPREGMVSRFGELLGQRLDQLDGVVPELIVPRKPQPALEASRAFEQPTTHRESIEQMLACLTEQVASQVALGEQGIVELVCRLKSEGRQTVDLRIGVYQPTVEAKHLWGLVELQLENLRLTSPLCEIQVVVTETAPRSWQQSQLFAGRRQHAPHKLAGFIDRLSSRLGSRRVVGVRLQPSSQPERAVRYQSLTGKPAQAKRRSSKDAASPKPNLLHRPLLLHKEPQRLEVMAVAPDGPPVGFRYQDQPQRVARHWGPERVETAWWRGRSVQRDYYRIETEQGARLWIFRRLQDGRWFLHGEFG